MRSLVWYFFLMVLKISFNLTLNAIYKRSKFFKTLSEKSFKFILDKKNSSILFIFYLILLTVEINLVSKKLKYKKDAFIICSTSYVKIIFAILTKVVVLYMQVFMV